MSKDLTMYDTTLRDGAQGEDVQLATGDKLKIALKLDELGLDYIEGGWPGSNQVDNEFFREVRAYEFKHARITAFGSTHHPSRPADSDPGLNALRESGASVFTVFGKSSERHARDALRLEPARNLEIVRDTVAFLRSHAEKVFFDAEHFFDGYKENAEYSLAVLKSAHEAGAAALVLCDTNGGCLPADIAAITGTVARAFPGASLGIHTHNDCDLAVANALAAVQAGVTHVQGTMNGLGERCGNANLCSLIPLLEIKLGRPCLPKGKLSLLTAVAAYVSEVANLTLFSRQPFVGHSAFAHKGGVHVSAVNRDSGLYEHMKPELVGNGQRILITELGGRSNIVALARRFGFHLDKDEPVVRGLFGELKQKASSGYDYAAAEASVELLLLRKLARRGVREFFRLHRLRVLAAKGGDNESLAEATIMVEVEGVTEHTAATGKGPVNAMDNALRKALLPFYPRLGDMRLRDFKVRVLPGVNAEDGGTASVVRVLIESGDSEDSWVTVGVDHDIIEASWQALADSVVYKLYRDEWREHEARQS
jgi:2-isopropylmalate synthase